SHQAAAPIGAPEDIAEQGLVAREIYSDRADGSIGSRQAKQVAVAVILLLPIIDPGLEKFLEWRDLGVGFPGKKTGCNGIAGVSSKYRGRVTHPGFSRHQAWGGEFFRRAHDPTRAFARPPISSNRGLRQARAARA